MGLFGGKGGGNEAAQARADEQQRQSRIRQGTSRVNGIFDSEFNNDYFKGRKEAYLGYATPQLEDQYDKAGKELTFALARSGQLDSSVRGQKMGELQKLYDLNKQQIADQALAHEGQARSAVEDARGGLIATLNATGDAEGAANSAITRSSALSQPAAYSPLGQLFVDFTNGLGIQAAQERAEAASGGSYRAPYNTGLFGGAGRVVNR